MKASCDMTSGNISRQLLWFSMPLLVGSLIQQLYNTVDLIFIGNLVGKSDAAAVGASTLLVTCMVGLFTGLSVGAAVVAGHKFGSGNYSALQKLIQSAITISVVGGALLMLVGIFFAQHFLGWMNTPADIFPMARNYIQIYFLSIISMVFYNIGAGIIRALGDSFRPMLYQLFGGIANVLANAILIGLCKFGVAGAAYATLCSQTLAAVLVLWHLCQLPKSFRPRGDIWNIDREIVSDIFKIGIPAGIQSTAITLSNIFVQYKINALGIDAIAAFAAYFKVELFIFLPILAFGQAISAFVAQNIGARKFIRLKNGVRIGLGLGVAITVALSLFLLLLIVPAFRIFISDESVISLGVQVGLITFPLYFIYLVMEVLSAAIRGAGASLPPMIILVFSMCVFRPLLLILAMNISVTVISVAWVYPITWFIAMSLMAGYYLSGRWMSKAKI